MIRIPAASLLCVVLALATGGATVAPGRAAGGTAPGPPAPAAAGIDTETGCREDDIHCHETLYQLEETLFAYEQGVAAELDPAAARCWASDVEAFRRAVDACVAPGCREAALRERLAGLHFLQPQAAQAAIDLPEAPQLVAVLAPETEDGAGPPPASTPPPAARFEARGALVHAGTDAAHMGIAVRAAGGAEHVFIFDMEIGNQRGHDEILGLVGASPTAQVLVRGQRGGAPDGIANFDTGQCRIVHQLP